MPVFAEIHAPPTCTTENPSAYCDIVRQIRAHDPAGPSPLYDLIGAGSLGYFVRREPSCADDLFHQFFVDAVESIRKCSLRDPRRLMGFLQTVRRRHYARHVRSRIDERSRIGVNENLPDWTTDVEQAAIRNQQRSIAFMALDRLRPREREIFVRFYVKEQPEDQIMGEMGLTEVQYRLAKSRAKAVLAKRIQGHLGKAARANTPFLRLKCCKMAENSHDLPVEYVLLELALPHRPILNVGVLLLDAGRKRLYWQLRSEWEDVAPPQDAQILAALQQDFEAKTREMGGEELLLSLEDQLSNTLRVTDRNRIWSDDPATTLQELFQRYCC